MNEWTTDAMRRWQGMQPEVQQRILRSVWCGSCGELIPMKPLAGTIMAGDLVLSGTCTVCGQRVARLIEHEVQHTPRVDEGFQPGDDVVWMKRVPGGPYVIPLPATVLGVTSKRVKIEANDDGQLVIRYVPRESLQRKA